MWKRVLRSTGPQLWRAAGGSSAAATDGASRAVFAAPAARAPAAAAAAASAAGNTATASQGWLLAAANAPPTWAQASAATSALSARGFATQTQRKAAANPGLKYWNPTTPGQRGRVTVRRTGIWRGGPKRCLVHGAAKSGGRNHSGRITVWHRGGGARKVVRAVDFARRTDAPEGVVERLEYDPGRTGYIALVRHDPSKQGTEIRELADRAARLRAAAVGGASSSSSSRVGDAASTTSSGGGGGGAEDEYRQAVAGLLSKLKSSRSSSGRPAARKQYSYILAPQDLKPGDVVTSAEGAPIRPGNTLRLRDIPVGMAMHNLELRPGQGAALCRSAGCVANIVNKQETHAIVRLPSGGFWCCGCFWGRVVRGG